MSFDEVLRQTPLADGEEGARVLCMTQLNTCAFHPVLLLLLVDLVFSALLPYSRGNGDRHWTGKGGGGVTACWLFLEASAADETERGEELIG
jgi:hypothetical protein